MHKNDYLPLNLGFPLFRIYLRFIKELDDCINGTYLAQLFHTTIISMHIKMSDT